MERMEVDSSMILEMGYDEETKTLEVKFKKGNQDVWQYTPITKEGYMALLGADSLGAFFIKNVRDNTAVNAKQVG